MEDRCPYFGTCGGCSLQDVPMPEQLESKQNKLIELLCEHEAGEPLEIMPPIDGPAWGYRHRARLAAKFVPKKGGAMVGFMERGKPYVTDMVSCDILAKRVSALIGPLRSLIGSLSISNRVPQIEVAVGDDGVALTLRHLNQLNGEDLARLRAFQDEHGVSFYLQPAGPDSVAPLNPESARTLSYSLPEWDLKLEFGPLDFVQINPKINRSLIRRVIDLLEPQPEEPIADLFCGLGNFSLPLAKLGARVTGFELVQEQVARASDNAKINNLENLAEFRMQDLYSKGIDPSFLYGFDKILLDPPRSGAEDVLKQIPESLRRIVYVSCNPETLARDARILKMDKNFTLSECGIVNMFPHTLHAEAIAVFER